MLEEREVEVEERTMLVLSEVGALSYSFLNKNNEKNFSDRIFFWFVYKKKTMREVEIVYRVKNAIISGNWNELNTEYTSGNWNELNTEYTRKPGVFDDNHTPLTYAISIDRMPMVKKMLENNVYTQHIDHKTNYGKTALMMLIEKKKEDLVNLCIQAGAHVNVQDNKDNTALMLAVERNIYNPKIVDLLLNSDKINLGLKDKNGYTALIKAISNDIEESKILQIIEKSTKENINVTTKKNNDALFVACDKKKMNIAKKLIQKGSDVAKKIGEEIKEEIKEDYFILQPYETLCPNEFKVKWKNDQENCESEIVNNGGVAPAPFFWTAATRSGKMCVIPGKQKPQKEILTEMFAKK